jgi:hypothetical protein
MMKGCENVLSNPFRIRLVIDLYQGFRAALNPGSRCALPYIPSTLRVADHKIR